MREGPPACARAKDWPRRSQAPSSWPYPYTCSTDEEGSPQPLTKVLEFRLESEFGFGSESESGFGLESEFRFVLESESGFGFESEFWFELES